MQHYCFSTPTLYFGEDNQHTPNSGSGHLGALETYIWFKDRFAFLLYKYWC